MGSVSVTYTENIESSYKATWTYTLSASDISVTGSKFTVTNGTVTSKYVYSGKARAESDITYSPRINGVTQSREFYKANTASGASDASWSSNASKTLVNVSGYPTSLEVNTSTFFNANNKTTRTIPLTYYIRNVWAYSQKNTSGDQGNGIDQSKSTVKTTGTVANITLNVPPTATVSALTTDTPYIYTGLTTASVTVSDTAAYYGGDVTNVTLTIGNQSDSLSGDGTLSIALDTAGTFTPTVTVTDSRGQTKSYPLDPITVNSYTAPSVSFDVDRTNSSGQVDDEGTYCLITATLTFSDVITSALAPSVVATDENGTQTTPTVNWYTDDTLTTAVTWANVSSGDTVYGIFSGVNTQYSYQVSVRPRDSEGTGEAIVQTLSSAFYTVDFLAGGHGIAFGQPSSQDGFYCNMDANFMKDVLIDLPDYQTTGTTDKAIYDAVVALGWDSDVIV